MLEPATPEEFRLAWIEARERGHWPRILGGGANLLIADGTLEGVVITTDRMQRVFRPGMREAGAEEWTNDAAPDEALLVAWAGAGMPGLVRVSRELGWTGLEGLAGVPGHLGGGVAMNAGGRWGELWDVVERVHVLSPSGETRELPRAECTPGYRDGGLGDDVVLGAALRLTPGNKAEVAEAIKAYLAEKSAVQPVTEHSSGCVFKNPDPELSDGRSAGKLVEDCGAKGRRRGGAEVSTKHGNFVVNKGDARAEDVLGLIEEVRGLVADATGIVLETEVQVWGNAAPGDDPRP